MFNSFLSRQCNPIFYTPTFILRKQTTHVFSFETRFKFSVNEILVEEKRRKDNTLFQLIVDFAIQCKEYLESSRVESIELEFSWEVRGGERAYVITWKKFQSGGERSRC